jgi:molybdopterin-containing oxidoreductase family membrane subunit
MVLTLAIPLRVAFGLHDFITERHMRNMAKVMLATGLIVVYGYTIELFVAWYGGNPYEQYMIVNRVGGPYRFIWYALILCNAIAIQPLWFSRVRRSVVALWIVSMFINLGMWLERFIIVITSLHRDFMPSSWDMYYPTVFDYLTFFGTIGLFLSLMFLFIRLLPMIAIFEMRLLVPKKHKAEAR